MAGGRGYRRLAYFKLFPYILLKFASKYSHNLPNKMSDQLNFNTVKKNNTKKRTNGHKSIYSIFSIFIFIFFFIRN